MTDKSWPEFVEELERKTIEEINSSIFFYKSKEQSIEKTLGSLNGIYTVTIGMISFKTSDLIARIINELEMEQRRMDSQSPKG